MLPAHKTRATAQVQGAHANVSAAALPPTPFPGLLSVAAMAALLMLDSGWYAAHRSTLVAGMRIASAAMLLAHRHMDPGVCVGTGRGRRGTCCTGQQGS